MPIGGYRFLMHNGSQLWYMSITNTMHLTVNGVGSTMHSGAGEYFYDSAALKFSDGTKVAMDYAGNIILCESDSGSVPRIRFESLNP